MTKKSILKLYPQLRRGIRQVQREVLGHAPQLNHRTGYKKAAKQLKGVYYNQYYMDPIAKFARKVSSKVPTVAWCVTTWTLTPEMLLLHHFPLNRSFQDTRQKKKSGVKTSLKYWDDEVWDLRKRARVLEKRSSDELKRWFLEIAGEEWQMLSFRQWSYIEMSLASTAVALWELSKWDVVLPGLPVDVVKARLFVATWDRDRSFRSDSTYLYRWIHTLLYLLFAACKDLGPIRLWFIMLAIKKF